MGNGHPVRPVGHAEWQNGSARAGADLMAGSQVHSQTSKTFHTSVRRGFSIRQSERGATGREGTQSLGLRSAESGLPSGV